MLRIGRLLEKLAAPGLAVGRQDLGLFQHLPATTALPTRRLLNKLSTAVAGPCLNADWSHLITSDGIVQRWRAWTA